MMRLPLRFVSEEDRQSYRKLIRVLVLTYSAIIVLSIGAISYNVHQNSNTANLKNGTVSVAQIR
jgi:hypothetical protein